MVTAGYIFVIIVVLSLLFLSNKIPETGIYLGHEIPKKYLIEIIDLGLLEANEQIKFFYTDGIFDIKNGLYFVTDTKFVAYCKKWEEPKKVIRVDEIVDLDIEYKYLFTNDSNVYLKTKSGFELEFPLSSEKDRDKEFYYYLLRITDLL